MTTVQLNDGPGKKPWNAKPNYPNNEPNGHVKDQSIKSHKNNAESQPPKEAAKEAEKPAVEEDTTPRDYDTLPRLEGNLTAGDTIAYKVISWCAFDRFLCFICSEELTDNRRDHVNHLDTRDGRLIHPCHF